MYLPFIAKQNKTSYANRKDAHGIWINKVEIKRLEATLITRGHSMTNLRRNLLFYGTLPQTTIKSSVAVQEVLLPCYVCRTAARKKITSLKAHAQIFNANLVQIRNHLEEFTLRRLTQRLHCFDVSVHFNCKPTNGRKKSTVRRNAKALLVK